MNEQLVRALIDVCVFLEYSGDDVIEPDAAVKAFEDLAATLQSAEPSVQRELRSEISRQASSFGPGTSSFVEHLADHIGLHGAE
ncbi:hypothetical protein FIV34_17665 [Luteibacter pinisoli]|uniref:CdiI immunity protein domain-containing protein n=1 Tax=Luteibacter pinisoli TaxID=2589080 RepID=A0A4Y5Z9W3_9GAMM|nr:hypothetical protein [Luteibacter pinisoli]QDE40908.1 hypothetical protein FIV34_17665 [Luteibacter pinisoli]